MILTAFTRALAQLPDRRFRRVLLLGLGLTVGLLVAITWALLKVLGWLLPETVSLPWIGEIGWLTEAASGLTIVGMLAASVFMMVPVASAFTSIFLEDVAEAVEDRYYPDLPPADRVPLLEALRDSLGFLGVLLIANLAALVLYLIFPPAAPVIFWALNGFLLGREYFQVAAMRRLGRAGAAELRRRNRAMIWLAGTLMAIPLSIPVINLLVPVLGAATFTHLFHAVAGRGGVTPAAPDRPRSG